MIQRINIGPDSVGPGCPIYVIAEAGVNHNGKLAMALRMIREAAKAGAHAIKFQTFSAEEVVSKKAGLAAYQKKSARQARTQYALLKKLELRPADYPKIIAQCRKYNITWLSTPHGGFTSLSFLHGLEMSAFKFGSGDLTNLPLLTAAAKFGKPMIVSTGMATLSEVQQSISAIKKSGNQNIVVLQATSSYPCHPEDVNLSAMQTLATRLKVLAGFSDHTVGDLAATIATSLGAVMIEKHFTLNKNLPGPDHRVSATPAELQTLIEKVKGVQLMLGSHVKTPPPEEHATKRLVRKSLITLQSIQKGERFSKANLGIKRPGTGIPPSFFEQVLSKKALKNLAADTLIEHSDYANA